ncbi:ABC transporter ATP-binding protein [Desulfuromonas carbonis]|uniref:ABC transporter ATP-binding protein n=1 Tax=Desulfuromonas sp. DDH964 TaxID=1823759 RepID=UPI00078CD7EB|nr:ABC transporter ATP-binding protein [Desulfuromonas sp. DDH964]AMV71455.1 ABC transporter ATP-binding protein [Desulfuromonas sp. DDH964]
MAPLIETMDLYKTYNPGRPDEIRALQGVSVQIEAGEVVALKGPSGSGKTTLLSLLGCMSRPTSGRVTVAGRDVSRLPERFLTEVRRQTFGFIFQQFNLLRDVGVLENVLLPLYPQDCPPREMQRRATELLDQLGLGQRRQLKVRQLSGGEQQRVAIARALVNAPQIVVADEPTAHLDSELAAELLEILTGLQREGKTIVIATHDRFVFEHPLITRVVAMRDGRLAVEAP